MLPRVALAKAMRQIFYWIKILAVSFRHVNILLNWWPKPVSPDAVTFAFVCYDWLETQIGQKFILKRFVIAATWLATFWPFVACPCKLFFKRVCRLLINFFFLFFPVFLIGPITCLDNRETKPSTSSWYKFAFDFYDLCRNFKLKN